MRRSSSSAPRRSVTVLALLLASCGAPPSSDPVDPEDSGEVDSAASTLEPGSVTGQEGELIVVQRGGTVSRGERFAAFAAFADDLQGLRTPAWCFAGGPCLPELPAVGQFADTQPDLFDPGLMTWAFNGHHLNVSGARVPLHYNPQTGAAWYQGGASGRLNRQATVGFTGDWGQYRGTVPLPEPLQVLSPDPRNALPLNGTLRFRWAPTGGDDVYLYVSDGTLNRLYHLQDDGDFALDIDALGLSGEQISIGLQRWATHESVDVHGNSLAITSVWEQAFEPLLCDVSDYPVGNLAYGPYPLGPYIYPSSVGVSFQVVIDDHQVHDFWLDLDRNGINDLYTSAMLFDFYDDFGQRLCTIAYDASGARPVANPVAQGGGTLFEGWSLDLLWGYSDCNQVDPLIWGTTDLRHVLEGLDWGFGIGTIVETEAALRDRYDWNLWQPLLAGAYILFEGAWYEMGSVSSVGMESCGVVEPTLAVQPRPTGSPLPIRLYLGNAVFSFPL